MPSNRHDDSPPFSSLRIELPWGKSLELEPLAHGDGELLHLRIREGKRFTTLDIDPETAERWARAMLDWAEGPGA